MIGLTKDFQRPTHVIGMGHDIRAVAFKQLIFRLGREQRAIATDTDNHSTQRGKQIRQLAQRRIYDGTVFINDQTQQLRPTFKEAFRIEGCRRAQALQGSRRNFAFGRNHNVNRYVIAAIKIGIDRAQIGLRPQAGNLARDRENRMGHLTGDHVDLVGIGGGDDHIRVTRTCAFKHVGIGCKPCNPLNVQRICRAAHKVGIVVDHGHIVSFTRQMAGNLPTDLPCTTNDDFHAPAPRLRIIDDWSDMPRSNNQRVKRNAKRALQLKRIRTLRAQARIHLLHLRSAQYVPRPWPW